MGAAFSSVTVTDSVWAGRRLNDNARCSALSSNVLDARSKPGASASNHRRPLGKRERSACPELSVDSAANQ
jgi:hypothetical protein